MAASAAAAIVAVEEPDGGFRALFDHDLAFGVDDVGFGVAPGGVDVVQVVPAGRELGEGGLASLGRVGGEWTGGAVFDRGKHEPVVAARVAGAVPVVRAGVGRDPGAAVGAHGDRASGGCVVWSGWGRALKGGLKGGLRGGGGWFVAEEARPGGGEDLIGRPQPVGGGAPSGDLAVENQGQRPFAAPRFVAGDVGLAIGIDVLVFAADYPGTDRRFRDHDVGDLLAAGGGNAADGAFGAGGIGGGAGDIDAVIGDGFDPVRRIVVIAPVVLVLLLLAPLLLLVLLFLPPLVAVVSVVIFIIVTVVVLGRGGKPSVSDAGNGRYGEGSGEQEQEGEIPPDQGGAHR